MDLFHLCNLRAYRLLKQKGDFAYFLKFTTWNLSTFISFQERVLSIFKVKIRAAIFDFYNSRGWGGGGGGGRERKKFKWGE